MRSSLRLKLLATFLVLVVVAGAGTLIAIERTLANDLLTEVDLRMSKQAGEVADWLRIAGHPDRLAPRLAAVTGARITIVGANGLVQGDSAEPESEGHPIGDASEISKARRGETGRAIRRLRAAEAPQYLIAIQGDLGRVIRLAVPLGNVIETRTKMRARLLVGGGIGLLGSLVLSIIFIRALTRPLQEMTRTAERLAAGDFEVPPPPDAGGELGVLGRAMSRMAGEVKARVGELTQQRDLLTVVFGRLVEGVVVVDPAGAPVLVNDAAGPMLDAAPGGPAVPPPIAPLVARALAGEDVDEELQLADRAIRASARPLGQGGAIVVLYDVTRMRSLEAVRREFLSNAAHELRTPVTSIAGYAETLLAGGVDAETQTEFLTTIHRNADRIASLVTDLVLLDTLGGRDSVLAARVPVALARVVRDAVQTAKGVSPGAQVEVAIDGALAVLATRDAIDHVVQNLVDNAIKYGGGTAITITATQARTRVTLVIEDGGAGIPPGLEERIFERFFRIDPGRSRDRGGTGLGLAIVKSQIEALGGRVRVESAAPGARFVVELDAASPEPTPLRG